MAELQKVKENANLLANAEKIYNAIISISTSGVFSNIVRIIVMTCMGIGWWLFKKKLTELQIKYAAELSVKEQDELRAYLEGINKKSDDAKVTDLEKDF